MKVGVAFLHGRRIEGVENAVAAAEIDLVLSVHFPERRRTPLAVLDVRPDLRVVLAEQIAGVFVERDEGRRERRGDIDVRPVLSVRGADEEPVTEVDDRAIRGVVRKDAEFIHHVVPPEDVGILWRDFDLRLARSGHVLAFVLEWSLIAVRLAIEIEADHFATAGRQPNFVALDGRRTEQAEILPVIDLARRELRHHELPDEVAGVFVEAHQDRTVVLETRVARGRVVRADEHLAVRRRPDCRKSATQAWRPTSRSSSSRDRCPQSSS